METAAFLAETIGPRPAGSPEERRAADYLARRLTTLGLRVERHPFTFRGWRALGGASVNVDSVGEMEAVALPYTDATGPTGVSGDLRFDGILPIIPGRLLCPRFSLRDRTGASTAALLGSPAGEARPLPNPQPLLTLPTAVIGANEAEHLRALCATSSDQPRATVLVPAVWEGPLRSENLVVANAPSDDDVVLVAHYDSVQGSPGANDNASGTALLLRLAERLREAAGLRFVFCGAEEPFLVGSRAYVREVETAGRLHEIAGCLNFDMVGVGETFSVRRQEGSLWDKVATLLSRDEIEQADAMPSSDHWAFHESGIPSAQLTKIPDLAWHSSSDTTDRFFSDDLEAAGDVATSLISSVQQILRSSRALRDAAHV